MRQIPQARKSPPLSRPVPGAGHGGAEGTVPTLKAASRVPGLCGRPSWGPRRPGPRTEASWSSPPGTARPRGSSSQLRRRRRRASLRRRDSESRERTDLAETEGSRRNRPRGSGTSLAARRPRCSPRRAEGWALQRPPPGQGAPSPPGAGSLRYAPGAVHAWAAATPGRAGSHRLSQPGRKARRSWASTPGRTAPARVPAWARSSQRPPAVCFPSPALTVSDLVVRFFRRPGQPLGAGKRRRGPAGSLERPDGNTL